MAAQEDPPQGERRGPSRLLSFLRHPELGSIGRSVGIASAVGVAAGLAAIAFEFLIHRCKELALVRPFGLVPGQEGVGGLPWLVILVPALGGLLAGWMIQRWAPEAEGHGTEQLIHSFHRQGGVVRRRVVAVKAIASALTIGSGGSAGQEGPVAQMGSGVGSALSDAFKLGDRDRRIFLLTGATAGIGAMFSAPLGAALFVPEVLYRKPEFEGDAIIPCIIGSIIAYTTKESLSPSHGKAIEIPGEILESLSFHGPSELPAYVVLALLCTLVGWIYIRTFDLIRRGFSRMKAPRWIRPAIGGLLLGLLAFAVAPIGGRYGLLFGGYDLMVGSIQGSIGIQALLVLIAGKIVATSLSIGSGGSGGMFAPSLAIGALLGCLVGRLAQAVPGLGELDPSGFALVGMGGFFAGVANTPIAATIIVCEMTGSYTLLAPLMLVSVIHMILARRWTLYDSQVDGQVDSPAHTGKFIVDVLERMSVAEVVQRDRPLPLVSQNATLRAALDIVSTAVASYFPVVDDRGKLVGIFSLSDIRRIFLQSDVQDLVIVKDFMVDKVATIKLGDGLSEALHLLNEYAIHEIPVVSEEDPREVVAMLSRNVLGAAYDKRLQELRKPDPEHA